jgi:hypothetical protein
LGTIAIVRVRLVSGPIVPSEQVAIVPASVQLESSTATRSLDPSGSGSVTTTFSALPGPLLPTVIEYVI